MRKLFRRNRDRVDAQCLRGRLDNAMRDYADTEGSEYFDGYTDALAAVLADVRGTDRLNELITSASRVGINLTAMKLAGQR